MAEETLQASLLGKIAAYTEILQKDPNSTIFVSLSEAYRKLGQLADARRIVEAGLERHQDFSPGHIVLARILCQQSDYPASDAAFSKALELDGNSLAGLVGYARLLVLTDEIEKARELLLTARSLSPADPVINKFLNSLPAAENEEETAAESSEMSAPLISETLADLYMKQGLPDKALEIFRELLRNDPDDLELRRRIRDAELMMQGELVQTSAEGSVEETVDDVSSVPPSTSLSENSIAEPHEELPDSEIEAGSIADDLESQDLQSDSDQIESDVPANLSPLGVLNQWLENIQKRRSNV